MKRILVSILTCSMYVAAQHDIAHYFSQARQAMDHSQHDQAIRSLLKIHELAPTQDVVISHLAKLYMGTEQYEQSCAFYEKFIALHPNDGPMLYNLATTYSKIGQFEKAREFFERAYRIEKDDVVRINLVKSYLRDAAWQKARDLFPVHLWWYNENLYGKTVFLDIDRPGNGLGDAIQFIRYARYLHQAGAHVTVKASDALAPLLSLCPYISKIVGKNNPEPSADKSYAICIASLMLVTRDRLLTSARDVPYLFAKKELINEWQQRLSSDPNFKIGVAWECNQVKNRFTNIISHNARSIPLTALEPLTHLPGITFYCLQKKPIDVPETFPLVRFDDELDTVHGRFMDTAAIMKNLDLIITVDTSVAHLAGALGVPVWLLLNCESDYRWFKDRSDSPYYPTMRIFRQKTRNAWQPVVEQVKKELSRLILIERL